MPESDSVDEEEVNSHAELSFHTGTTQVDARYQFFFVACRPGASECSDELIDCPSSADLNVRWWEGFAETLAESSVSTATSFDARLNRLLALLRRQRVARHRRPIEKV